MLNPHNKIVLLDRDGVVNIDSDAYIKSAEEWHPIPGSLEAMARLSRAGYRLFIVTNQSGLARQLFSPNDLEAMHAKMRTLLNQFGGTITDIAYCPHHPEDNCRCRKPKTGLLDLLQKRHEISFTGVPFVGDSLKDLDCAAAVGANQNLVLTGKGQKTLAKLTYQQPERLKPLPVYNNLYHAVETWFTL